MAWPDAVTAVAAGAGAGIGGFWTWFRYRREDPYLPRVNASLSAELHRHGHVDYLSFTVEIQHQAGGQLSIEQPENEPENRPNVLINRLSNATETGEVPSERVTRCRVLQDENTLAAGEGAQDHGLVAVSHPPADTFGYELRFSFCGHWKERDPWTWSRRKIIRCDE